MVNNFCFLSTGLHGKLAQVPEQQLYDFELATPAATDFFFCVRGWSMMPPVDDELTNDTLFQGGLQCRQYRHGYRFSVDALLAAHFLVPTFQQRILDLGCGCGIIGLLIAYLHHDVRVAGLEVQEELAALAAANGRINSFSDRFEVTRGCVLAIASLYQPEIFDWVVCNPPYRQKASGRVNQISQAARARHELTADLADFVRASAYCVKNKGRVVFVYPASRCSILLKELVHHRLSPKRLQPVYSYPEATEAKLILVEAMKNGGEHCTFMAPMYLYEQKHGRYTQAMRSLYEKGKPPC